MVVERHYTKEGLPAYVTVFQRNGEQPGRFLRLVYPNAAEFERLWEIGTDWSELVLD